MNTTKVTAQVQINGRRLDCEYTVNLKALAGYTVASVVLAVLIGGCVRTDYSVFKAKFPNASKGDYVWSKLFQP